MPESIGGIPLHPLVVHAVVVLVPLAALGLLAVVVFPALARRYSGLLVLLTLVAGGAVPVAIRTGQQLREGLQASLPAGSPTAQAIETHARLGQEMYYVAPPLVIATVLVWWMTRRDIQRRPLGSAPRWLVRIASVVAAVVGLVWVVRVGHSGAATIWKGVGQG